MKKKLVLSLAAAAMVGTLAVGGTLAWFTDTEQAVNVVTTGNVDIAWYEGDGTGTPEKITESNTGMQFETVVPGQNLDKEAHIMNEGKNSAYIRAKIVFEDKDGVEITKPDAVEIVGTNSKWVYNKADQYYYYTDPVAAGSATEKIMTDVTIDAAKATNENFTDKEFQIRLDAEAVQSDNLGEGIDTCEKAFGVKDLAIISYDTEQ